jgi:hypothetical protein
MYLFESKKNYEVSFNYKGESEYYSSNVFRKVYTDTINWLYDNGYKFDERVRGRELINSDEVPTNYEGHGVHYIPNTNYAILVNFGIPQSIRYLRVMLERFGATDIDIKTSEQPSIIKKFGEIDTFDPELELIEEEPNEHLGDYEDELENSEDTPQLVRLRSEFWSLFLPEINKMDEHDFVMRDTMTG